MTEWIFPTLSEILALNDETLTPIGEKPTAQLSTAQKRLRAEREWFGAIAALETMLQQSQTESGALVVSGPLPVLSASALIEHLTAWSFTADVLLNGFAFQLPPADPACTIEHSTDILSLLPGDPLAAEPFCLAMTDEFSLIMVLGEAENGDPAFLFSFDPDVVERVWQTLRLRVVLMNPAHLEQWDQQYISPAAPNYKLVTQFNRFLLSHLPEPVAELEKQTVRDYEASSPSVEPQPESFKGMDVELLQAIAHEVRTPLTTIRTLTRLLLRRRDLPPDVMKRLEIIDRECSEQIDRFGLIFRAVEIETSATNLSSLAPTSLMQVIEQSIPRWQKQASQRNLTLDVILPSQLPTVVSDPTMLDQALTSLIDRSARSLPAGSRIQVEVSLAGHQLKLQLRSLVQEAHYDGCSARMPLLKSLGRVLMFQPETGTLSLNLNVTKNLFQALGGKLIVREHPEQGEVFTLFLPLEPNKTASHAGLLGAGRTTANQNGVGSRN